MVLDRVVSAALEHLSNLGPLVADNAVHEEEDPLLFFVPIDLLNAWVEVVVPALAALLSHTTVQVLRNEGPLLRAVGDDKLEHAPVLFCGPCTFDVERLAFFLHFLHWQKGGVSLGLQRVGIGQLLVLMTGTL